MKYTALYVAATKYTHDENYDKNLAIIQILLSRGADRSHEAYGGLTSLEFVRRQRGSILDYIPEAETDKIRTRHEASLDHTNAIISLLEN